MKVDMLMPQLGESIAEATVLKWLKKVGDKIEKDETIVEISTDKVDSEIPSPESGTLAEILVKEGETADVKSVIARIETDSSVAVAAAAPVAPEKVAKGEAKQAPLVLDSHNQEAVAPLVELEAHSAGRFYSPLVRNLAAQHGVTQEELDSITGTGAGERVSKNDILEFVAKRSLKLSGQLMVSSPSASGSQASKNETAPRPQYGDDGLKVEPMDKMRKLIAEHMVRSKATSPHVYTVAEVDVSQIAKWRKAQQAAFEAREGFKLSFTPFFLDAATKALVQLPYLNASVEDTNIVLKRDINLGCAVALGTTGLIVPVIKNADQLNLVGLARALNDIAARARSKKLEPSDVQGGTFTVTNLGTFGNILGCPIINQPQVAILGIGAIKKRPVVVNDMIAIREMVYLTLSYDHRIIDGSMAGRFLQSITKYLEGWDLSRTI